MKTIYLSGDVGYEITASKVREMIKDDSTVKLRVLVNSYGGSVIEAFEIYNIFKQYKGKVEFVITGIAASAMSYIIMAGDEISAFKNSMFMAHKAWSVGIGDSDELEKEANILKAIDGVLAEAYTGRLGKTKEEILKDMKNELWLIGWEAMSEAGIIDNVIDKSDEIEIDAETKKEIEEIEKYKESAESAKIKVLSIKDRMKKDTEKLKSSMEKAAALLKNFNPETPEENNKIKQEGDMTLQEFIKSNPEAKAEYDKALESAKADGIKEASEPMQADRERIAKILKIAKAELSKEVVEAIEKDTEPGDFAIAQADAEKSRQQASNSKPTIFGDLVSKQTPKEQTANAQDAGVISVSDYEEKARSAFKKKEAK